MTDAVHFITIPNTAGNNGNSNDGSSGARGVRGDAVGHGE